MSQRSLWFGGALAVVALAVGWWVSATSPRPLLVEQPSDRGTSAAATEGPAKDDVEPNPSAEPVMAPERNVEPQPVAVDGSATAKKPESEDERRAREAAILRDQAAQTSQFLFRSSRQLAEDRDVNVARVALQPAEVAALDGIVADYRARALDVLVVEAERTDELLKRKVAAGDSRESRAATGPADERQAIASWIGSRDGKTISFEVFAGDDVALDGAIEKREVLEAEFAARVKAWFDELPPRDKGGGGARR